ncbi:MAG: carbohydrate porin [Pseudomonadota bacterium]
MNPTRAPFLLMACLFLPGPTAAADATPDYASRLFGDAGRSGLYARGMDVEAVYKLDLVGKLSNTPNRGHVYALDNLDIKLALDGGRLFGREDVQGLVHILGNHGGKPALKNDRLPHGLDNIEVPDGADTIKLYQAWLEVAAGETLGVKAGLYDLNSEFYVTDSSALFVHPTYGIGAEFAGTGRNGPSIFPTTSLALRLHWQPDPRWSVMAALLDGVPGDPNNPKGTHIQLNDGDGALQIVEAAWLPGDDETRDGKLALGVWRYTSRFDDLLDVDGGGNPIQRRSQGFYLIGEHRLARGANGETWGFLRWGRNNGDTTQFESAWSAGLVWTGLFAGRPEDQFGVTASQEDNSTKWQTASGNPIPHEQAVEIAYRGAVNDWLTLQTFAQYLLHHGNDPSQHRSWWLGVRLEFNL